MIKHFNIVLTIIVSCGPIQSGKQYGQDNKYYRKPPIVLVDLGESGLDRVSKFILETSKCNPKVVALDVQIQESDTSLANAIQTSKKIVLGMSFRDGLPITSSHLIRDKALAEGFIQFHLVGGEVAGHKIFSTEIGTMQWSLPMTILSYYEIEKVDTLLNHAVPNKIYRIRFDYQVADFNVVKLDSIYSLDCNLINDRILIMGYLDKEAGDYYKIRKTGSDLVIGNEMSGILILANATMTLLNSYLEPID